MFPITENSEVLFAWIGFGALECSLRSFHIENTVVLFQSYIFWFAASSSMCLLCPWRPCSAYLILHFSLHVAAEKVLPLLSRVTQSAKFAGSKIKVKNLEKTDNKGEVKESWEFCEASIFLMFFNSFDVILNRFSVLLLPKLSAITLSSKYYMHRCRWPKGETRFKYTDRQKGLDRENSLPVPILNNTLRGPIPLHCLNYLFCREYQKEIKSISMQRKKNHRSLMFSLNTYSITLKHQQHNPCMTSGQQTASLQRIIPLKLVQSRQSVVPEDVE